MTNDDIDWERLDRYVTGSAPSDEHEALERWVNSDHELSALAEAMASVGRPPDVDLRPWNPWQAWRQLQRRIRRVEGPPLRVIDSEAYSLGPGPAPPSNGSAVWPRDARARRRRPVTRRLVAAAVLVLATGSVVLMARNTVRAGDAVALDEVHEVTTERRQRATLTLPDGARVTLGPESRLRIPTAYSRTHGGRDLYLEGQAHFVVAYDSARPFRVFAANGVAQDLGTEFVVTAYPETNGMEVFVASGAVALYDRAEFGVTGETASRETAASSAQPMATLRRGDAGRLDLAGTAMIVRGVPAAAHTGWTHGVLSFDGAPLAAVVPVLERWYDIEIRLERRDLPTRRLTAAFTEEPLRQVLDLIAMAVDAEVEQAGPAFVLK